MLARHGNVWALKTRDRSLAFVFIRRILTLSTSLHRVTCGGRMKHAVSIVQRMAARPGKEFFTRVTKQAPAISQWTQRIRAFFTRGSGRSIANRGLLKAAVPPAESSRQPMVATPG